MLAVGAFTMRSFLCFDARNKRKNLKMWQFQNATKLLETNEFCSSTPLKLKVPVASASRVSCFTGHGSFNAVAASWCCAAVGLHFFLLPSDRAVEFDEIFVVCRAGQDRDPADEFINVH